MAALPPPTLGPQTQARATIERRLALGGATLRQHTARGTIINGLYQVGLSSLGFVRGFILAGLLSTADYGVWGILVVGVGSLYWIKQVGVSDKYVQQDEPDQELAFQKAFTLEAIMTAGFGVLLAVAIPLVALVYHQPAIIAPAYVFVAALPAAVFQAPIWVHFRRMDFVRQRTLQAFDPVTSFIVTIVLAVLGLGYWSLVLGVLAGNWVGAIAAVRACPYRIRLRYDRGTMREYLGFSGPLFVSGLAGFIVVQGSVLVVARTLGLDAVGYVGLAGTISAYADRVDRILADTLYPAICAVSERIDLLFETFVKSNRVALMWGMPFGIGVALFASDLVTYALGERWRPAVGVIVVFGLIAAADQVGYNWDDYYRARGQTRPVAWWSMVNVLATLGAVVPLTIWRGLDGFTAGMAAFMLVSLGGRIFFLARLFPAFAMARQAARAIAPTIPAVAIVLAIRWLGGGSDSAARAASELALFVLAVGVATIIFERELLRELLGYLRRRPAPAAEMAV